MRTDPILVTGAAGFIGYHLTEKLLARGEAVIGIDSLNDYYDVRLKEARLERLKKQPLFQFQKMKVEDRELLPTLFERNSFKRVVHLAAQAGVRYSLTHPFAYIEANLVGFTNILECCRHAKIEHLVYASSSSVYGANTQLPFSIHQNVDHPISLYAATKKSNELMAHCYSHLYQLPTTGLRFFTVYGPWGRPDMALFIFTKAILEGKSFPVFNQGKMERDFTYIDDIVEGVIRVLDNPATPNSNWNGNTPDPATSSAPYRVYNIGNNNPVQLLEFIQAIESAVGRKAQMDLQPMQPGDVRATRADVSDLMKDVGFKPDTPVRDGIAKFVEWYRSYYKV